MSTALLISRTPSYTRREASINSFSSTSRCGLELRALTAVSTFSAKLGTTVDTFSYIHGM